MRVWSNPWRQVALAALSAIALLFVGVGHRMATVEAAPTTIGIVEPSDDPDSWAYDAPTITINVGDKVTWRNDGEDVHTVTSDDPAFDSGDMKHGATWSYTFTTPGTYTYYCAPHTWMTGTIVVNG